MISDSVKLEYSGSRLTHPIVWGGEDLHASILIGRSKIPAHVVEFGGSLWSYDPPLFSISIALRERRWANCERFMGCLVWRLAPR
jgi:hypothetical protein